MRAYSTLLNYDERKSWVGTLLERRSENLAMALESCASKGDLARKALLITLVLIAAIKDGLNAAKLP